MDITELLEKVRTGNVEKHYHLAERLFRGNDFSQILEEGVDHRTEGNWELYIQETPTNTSQLGLYNKKDMPLEVIINPYASKNFERTLQILEEDIILSGLNIVPKSSKAFSYVGLGVTLSSLFLIGTNLLPENYYPDIPRIDPIKPFLMGLLGASVTFFSEDIRDSLQEIVDHYQSRNLPIEAYTFLYGDEAIDCLGPFIKEKYHSLI